MAIVLNFTPALTCTVGDCEEETNVGQLSECVIQAQCPLHGLMYECDQAAQFVSVERYVSYLFDGEGVAKVVSEVALDDVPGYLPFEGANSTDQAWLCTWSSGEKSMQLWVVWLVDDLTFEVYQQA